MKWFWRINYIITLYFIVIIPLDLADGSFGLPNLHKSEFIYKVIKIINIGGISLFISLFIDWIQFPLCLIAMILWKEQRTTMHFIYLSLLVLLNLIKWILWFLAVGEVTYKTI